MVVTEYTSAPLNIPLFELHTCKDAVGQWFPPTPPVHRTAVFRLPSSGQATRQSYFTDLQL